MLEGPFGRKTSEFAFSFTLENDNTLNFMVNQLDSYNLRYFVFFVFLTRWCFVPLKYAYLAPFEKKQPMGKLLKVLSLKFLSSPETRVNLYQRL